MQLTTERIAKFAAATAIDTTTSYLFSRYMITKAQERGWKRTERYYRWSWQPRNMIIGVALGFIARLAAEEYKLRQQEVSVEHDED